MSRLWISDTEASYWCEWMRIEDDYDCGVCRRVELLRWHLVMACGLNRDTGFR
jgi:hypothetical protein